MNGERIMDIWGARTPYGGGARWPARQDAYLVGGPAPRDVDRWVRGACLLCSNGCGLEVAVKDGRMVGVRGRAEDRINHGRLGPKGLYGWQGQQHDRLTAPLTPRIGLRSGGRFRTRTQLATWVTSRTPPAEALLPPTA